MITRYFVLLLGLIPLFSFGQIVNTAIMDTTDMRYQGKVVVEGYVDLYYAYNFNRPGDHNQPYLVSMSRHNEITANLAFIGVKYSSSRLRARLVPAVGTYINRNYRNEPPGLRNIVEASVGIKLFPDKGIWLDAGVIGSPFTNESAISKDHLSYTRSLGAEHVPYYLSGIKGTIPLSDKLYVYAYVINGWQTIQDDNDGKSVALQIEYRPSQHLLINWNTFTGREQVADSVNSVRYFSDIYLIYSKGPLSFTSSGYLGVQEKVPGHGIWWQLNAIARYDVSTRVSLTARAEYFNDKNRIVVSRMTNASEFVVAGASLGFNVKPSANILVRFEGREFYSRNRVFLNTAGNGKTMSNMTVGLTLWF